jgi:glutamate 5-kinase
MKNTRIVVRTEIATLMNNENKLDSKKMERFAMLMTNLKNSGRRIMIVTSGAIVLGSQKMGVEIQLENIALKQAVASIGQASVMKNYQNHFNHFNQLVAQVLLTMDIFTNEERVSNTQNTINALFDMGIIPIINENDTISTSDIELDDNYPLALNVAKITETDIILIKLDEENSYIIQARDTEKAIKVSSDDELFAELDNLAVELEKNKAYAQFNFPSNLVEIIDAITD